MKRTSLVTTAAVACAALLTAVPAGAQLPRDPAERARVIAQIMEMNARQLTIFDRQGQTGRNRRARGICTTSRCSPPTARAWR